MLFVSLYITLYTSQLPTAPMIIASVEVVPRGRMMHSNANKHSAPTLL